MPTGLGATYLWSQMETSRHRWRPLQLNGSACTSSHISYQIMLVLWSCRWWISTDSFREMRSSTVGGFEDMAIDMEESGFLVLIQLVTNSREYSCWNLPENQDFDYTYMSPTTHVYGHLACRCFPSCSSTPRTWRAVHPVIALYPCASELWSLLSTSGLLLTVHSGLILSYPGLVLVPPVSRWSIDSLERAGLFDSPILNSHFQTSGTWLVWFAQPDEANMLHKTKMRGARK